MCVYAQTPAAITAWTQQASIYPTTPGVLAPQMAGGAIYGDYIYVLGGNNNYDGDTQRVFKIKVNQFTGDVEPAVEVTDFPATPNYCYIENVCAAYNGYIYVSGGGYNAGGPNRNNVTFIKIVADGDLDAAWSTSTSFPNTPSTYDPELGVSVILNGYLYMMGGDGEFGGTFDRCYFAKIKGDGTLDTWQTGTTLPSVSWFPSACAAGNDIIMTIGLTSKINTDVVDTVYVCQTNPANGSMGSWALQAEKFPIGIYGTRLVAVGNTLFAIGGRASGGAGQSIVWRATYDTSAHTVGAWSAATDAQLPSDLRYHDVVYSDKSMSLYAVSIRNTALGIVDAVWISSPLFPRPTPTPTPTPIPVLGAKNWEMFQ